MLANFNTGYEGNYDFPRRADPPDIPYLLATVPRSGSTWVSHLLWRTGCLGAPLEYLNFVPEGPYGFASHSPENQMALWRSLLWRRTSPNGVFGIKCFPVQLHELEQTNPPLLRDLFAEILPQGRPRRVLYLARRDRVAHRVSYARAILSGVWRHDQERGDPGESPEYSEAALATAEQLIESQSAAWEQMFEDLRIEPLRLWYEDILAAPAEAVAQIATWLGVAIDPAAEVAVPEIRKQREGNAGEWIRRQQAEA